MRPLVVEINALLQRDEIRGASAYLSVTFVGGIASFYAGAMLVNALITTHAA